jgi:nucleoside-diphosphate-sugar epimerase
MNEVATKQTTLNICSGIATSFSELSHMIAEVIGKDIIVTVAGNKPKGVYYRVGDNTKAKSMGWTPKTNLKAAIEILCKYYL